MIIFTSFDPHWIARIILAALAGSFIGYERHSRSKEAGVRTHAIVALASCLLMIVSKYGFLDASKADAARVAAQVVSGIGFLGAGIIFVRNDTVQGLTTAAGVWATSGIGMAIGAGMYLLGILSTAVIIAIQMILHKANYFGGTRISMNLVIHITPSASTRVLQERLEHAGFSIDDMHIAKDPSDPSGYVVYVQLATSHDIEPVNVLNTIRTLSEVKDAEITE